MLLAGDNFEAGHPQIFRFFSRVWDVVAAPDLNASPAQSGQRYGKPVKVEPSFFGKGISYGFQPTKNTYVYATTNPSGVLIGSVMLLQVRWPVNSGRERKVIPQEC
jgi:hypothetical protein